MGPLDCKYIWGKFQLHTMTVMVKSYEIEYKCENVFSILQNIFSVSQDFLSVLQNILSFLWNIFRILRNIFSVLRNA